MPNPFDQFDQPATAGGNPFDQFSPAPAAQPETPGFVGALTRGFKRSLPETKGLLAGAGAAVAGAVGADGVRDKLLRTYQDIQQQEVAPLANQSGFIDSVTGDGSLREWAGDTLGNFAGQAVQSLAAGAAGAVVGSAVPGAGTVAGGVGGLVARTAAKDMVEGAVAKMVANGVAKDAAEKLVLRRMGGAALATTGLNVGQEIGIGYTGRAEDAAAAGEDLNRADALRAIGFGVPAGLLDTAAEAFTAGKLMRGASNSPNRLTRMAAGAATGAVTEGGTEGAQAVLERAGAAQALTGPEAYKDYIENIAAGALGGSVPGAAGGIRTPDALKQPVTATAPGGETTTPPPPAMTAPLATPPLPAGPLTRAAATLAGAQPAATTTPPTEVATAAAQATEAPAPGAPPDPTAGTQPAAQPAAAVGFEPTDLYKLAMDAAVQRGITSINGLQKELDIPREQARSLINALETANVLSKPDERKRRRLLIDPATGALLDEAAVKADRKQKSKQDRAELEAWARNLAGDLRVMDGLEQPRPDPAAGPVSAAAASAVDTGAADIVQMQQVAQQIEGQQPTAADQQRAQREQLQQAKMERQAQALDAQTYGEDDLRALIEADLDAGKKIDAPRMMRLAKQANVKPRAVDTIRRTILAERASGSQPALTDQPIDAEFTDVTGQDAPALPAPTVDPKVAGKLFPFPTEAAARASADKLAQRKGVPYTVAPHPREAGKWVAAPQSKATLALPAPAPAPAAQQPAPVEGEPIDAKWTAFAPESGTLGVPRAQMPQIRAEHRGALVNYLNARGIGHDSEQVPADSLKPTQAEFAPGKVRKAASHGTDRSILVSQDGHVLDGHHQWMAARNAGLPVNIIRLQAPIQELLQAAKEFPSSTVATGAAGTATGAATAPDTTTKEQSNEPDGQEGQQGQGRRREGRREALLSPGATVKQSLTVASPERDKALKRIERGTAFFGTKAKADEFIAAAGLADSHEAVQVKPGRFDVRAKQAAAVDVSTKPQNANTTAEGKPADAASAKVRQLADAEQRPGVKRSLNALADAMAAKDEKTVSAWVAENPDNTTLRKAFEDATGVKLPRTIKGGREAVSAWAAGKVDAAPQQAQDDQQQPTSAAPAQEGTGDTANRTGAATLDRAMVEGQPAKPVPAVVEQQSTSGAGPGDRRADAGSVRRGGGPARERSDRSGDVGNQRAIAIPAQDVADGGVEPDSVAVPANRGSVTREGTDYVPPAGSLERDGSWLKSAQRNVDAIELALRIKESGRPATAEQQAILAQYVGFGASEIRNKLFPVPSEYARAQQPDRVIWPNLIPDGPWKALAERLEKLPADAQKSLLRSTQYAHYTSEGVVRSIWRGLQHLGFTGGKIFEPGFGKGTFPMLMPTSIREGSLFTGIEMDHVSAMIGALLQPQQNMIEADYTKRKFPRDFFDVAIGNPPFARTAIESDPEYAKYRFSLHDYFFAKTVDRVRPGGLLVFVTSRYTMDKQNDRARKYLAERADLIGAVRLPQTAFKDNAGTDVVTDVLVLRKRMPGEAAGGAAWAGLAEVDTKDGKVSVNEYFASHPENVLGEQRISGNRDDLGRRINGLRSDGEYVVVSYEQQEEMEARFEQAMLSLPANVYSATLASPQQQRAETTKVDFDPKVRREGVVYIGDDGAIMRVESGVGVPLAQDDRATGGVKLTPANKAWLRGYVELRDKVQLARQAQLADGDWQSALDALNSAYDAFRKEHGPINDFTVLERTVVDEDGTETKVTSRRFKNKRILQEDYDRAVVMALETITEDNEIVKGPFLRGRTIGAPQPRTVQTIGDALAVSLDETGRLDLDDVARRLGISREQAIEDLGDQVFEVPGGTWVMADDYLSGDVRTKLDEAIEAARADSRFQRNVKALESAQPEKLGPSQIVAKLGASWIPEDVANAFAEHIGAGKVTFLPSTEGWQVAGGNKRTERRAGADFGTAHRSPSELLEAALNSRSVVVKKSVGEGKDRKEVTDKEATEAAAAMLKKIRDTFKTWVWADADRAATLTEIYNQRYNNIAPRRFDGSHLTLPGVSTRYKLHPHQKRAIWRQVASGNTYLAHAVGAGKTIEMIAGGMEQKRLGLIQKPMYVVPNHMLEQFANEFMELYPLANIMVADDENFTGDRRRSFIAQASMNKPDAIVITHSAFERIGVKPESAEPLKRELLDDLYAELAIAEKDKDQRVRRSQLEQQIEAVEQRFDKITGAGGKDNTITFEDMGVDMLYVDEAHAYRKLDFTTEQSIKGVDPNGSKRALDMYVKTRILEARRPGRAFVFASGTPVTNTMGELYTVQRFFQPAELQRMGISQFDSWSRQFGETVATLESNAAGRYELVERFAKFDNVPELMSRIRSFMDVLTSDQLGASVTRPDLEGGKPELIVVEGTDALKTYMRTVLQTRLERSKQWKPSKQQPHNPDPVIAITTDGRFAALDPRFFGAELPDGAPTKLNTMADEIAKEYHATADNQYLDRATGAAEAVRGGAQIVFYNLGFGQQSQSNRGFNARRALTDRLVEAGVKREHILWFDDADTDAKKEAMFKAMRSGQARILIGSAKKMGTGVNVQKRLTTLHYFDPPWFPSDVEQPHGRIIRQGNQNKQVRIKWYATKGTYDSTMWQMVARKQRFIDQAFQGDKNLRRMEDLSEASLFEQAAALASGDPRALQLAGLRQDVERLERLQAAHASDQVGIRAEISKLEYERDWRKRSMAELEAATKAVGGYYSFQGAKVKGRLYEKQGDFGDALKSASLAAAAKFADSPDAPMEPVVLGTLEPAGIEIVLAADYVRSIMNGQMSYKLSGLFQIGIRPAGVLEMAEGKFLAGDIGDLDGLGLARRVTNLPNRIGQRLRFETTRVPEIDTELRRLGKKRGAPFEYAQELVEKFAELKQLEADLEAEAKADAQRSAQQASAAASSAAFVAATNAEVGKASFAKSGEAPSVSPATARAWRDLAAIDGLFQRPRSDAKTFTELTAAILPGAEVVEFDDGATITVQPEKDANGKPAGDPKAVTMTVLDGELAMDASQLKAGVHRGSALYAVALAYAHNNGLVFVPDPAGVSDDAMIRRTEHMLSSALKTGTTRHMLPHPAQGLDWRVGDDQHNVLELIRASADNVMDAVPDLQAVDYDWNTGQFVAADGRPVTRDDFRALADSPSARAARAGVSTLRRGVVSRSLERRAGTPAWRGVVARLLQLGRAGLRGSQLEGLMYGRGATGARGMTVEALNGIFAPALKQLAADRRLDVQVVATHADLPQSIRDQDDFDDTVQAAFQGRTAYFVASAIRDRAQARRLFAHEVVGHYGMEGLLGPALFAELKRQILSLRDRGKWPQVFAEVSRRYERNADGTFRALDDDTFAAEAIAVFAERNIQTSLLQRAMAAVRAFLRRFFPDMEISKAELRQLLWEAGQRLEGRPYRPTAERALGAGRASSMRQAVERFSFGQSDQRAPFYSALLRSIEEAKGAPKMANAQAWKQWFDGAQRRGEFKQSERDWIGVDAWLDGQQGQVARKALVEFVRANRVQVQEVVLGAMERPDVRSMSRRQLDDLYEQAVGYRPGEDGMSLDELRTLVQETITMPQRQPSGAARFDRYQLPGGQNYRELLLTLPQNNSDPVSELSGLAHTQLVQIYQRELGRAPPANISTEALRFMVDSLPGAGSGTYSVFQSGHFDQDNILAHVRFNERTDADGNRVLFVEEVQSDWHQQGRKKGYRGLSPDAQRDGLPDAPLKKEWPLTAMKRMIRWAAENGFDRIAWTTGEQQAARYDLSKQVQAIGYRANPDGTYTLSTWPLNSTARTNWTTVAASIPRNALEDHVGKEIAKRITDGEGRAEGGRMVLDGKNLSVGGSGMRSFYDKMLPAELANYVKRWGGKVSTTTIAQNREGGTRVDDGAGGMIDIAGKLKTSVQPSIDITPAMRDAALQGQPLFARKDVDIRAAFAKAPSTLSRLQELIKPDDRSLLDRIKDRLQDWRPAALGALQLRHLGELAEDTLPPVAQYADVVQRMATMRNELQERGHGIVEAGMKYQGAHGEEAKRLFRMLHDATLAGVDPAEAHQPLRMLGADYRTNVEVTEKSVREFVRTMKGQAKLNAGSASVYIGRVKEARQLLQQERKRAQSHRQMAPAFAQLSPEAKALWVQMRDAYRAQSAEYEQALISRIEALDFDKAKKAVQIARMRLQFEAARVPFYVPLARWGEYWVSGTAPDGTREFYMQERASDQRRVRAELESRGYTAIGAGVKIDTARAQDGATAGFMAEMDQMLKDANAPEKVRDEAFQLYLRTLPDLSIRKNFIHRQGTPGYSQDAIRALAGHIFHGSFQIARMRYSHELDALRREAEQIARNMATMGDPEANGAGAVVNELKKRHEWVLNPTDNGLVNKISSVGFVYYLGLTPAAALVNLLQTPMVAFPVLAARHDAGKVGRELWRAMRESLGTYGHMERNLQGDELLAHQEFARRGVFDKTQAHNLAGVSESDTHAYSPGWHKVMTIISHVFHKAEVVNREATAMAAYRLARADGAGHAEAIHQADRDVHESQFDYSNANRARWMQSSAAKVLLMFRQYSLAVTWLIGRAFYQAIKGADPETRTMARRKLTGILGMTALFSGTLGLPVLGSVGAILNALAAAFGDDDEPWDWETELRAFLREMLGDTGAEAILRGPVQALTGVAIAQRVGMSDLWFREPDRELEGRAWANYLFEQAAGPMGGLVTNFFRGQQLMAEGHVWRGVETIMPKAIKDAMKSVRYVTDGVNNLRGDAIVEDLNVFESLAQIAGFSPASVASAYDYQRDIKGYEQYILDRRRALMDAFALAYRLGDIEGRDAVLAKMREFSAAYPALAITADGIRRSLMSRARYSQQADAGIIVDRRLRAGLEDRLGTSG